MLSSNDEELSKEQARLLARRVPRGHVADFVRHGAGQLSFGFGHPDQPGIDENIAARQREGIDGVVLDDLEADWDLGVGVARQVLAEAIDVLANDGIVYHLGLPLDFDGQLLTHSHLFVDRVEIHALAHIAIADLVGILLFVIAGKRGRNQKGAGGNEGQPETHEKAL